MRAMKAGAKIVQKTEYAQEMFYDMIVRAIAEDKIEPKNVRNFIEEFRKIIIPRQLREILDL